MKANKVYFIKVISDPDEGDENAICEDLLNIVDEDELGYIGFTEKNDMFLRLVSNKILHVCGILKKHNIKFEISEITSEIINGSIQNKYPEVEKLTPNIFTEFRIENTDVDDILDKINETGIESLDYIDKSILSGNVLNGKVINENITYKEKTHY